MCKLYVQYNLWCFIWSVGVHGTQCLQLFFLSIIGIIYKQNMLRNVAAASYRVQTQYGVWSTYTNKHSRLSPTSIGIIPSLDTVPASEPKPPRQFCRNHITASWIDRIDRAPEQKHFWLAKRIMKTQLIGQTCRGGRRGWNRIIQGTRGPILLLVWRSFDSCGGEVIQILLLASSQGS